jgi:hypothetical protein
MAVLPPLPSSLRGDDGTMAWGLYAGEVTSDPVPLGPSGGHPRRWLYAAATGQDAAVGAAVVEAFPAWLPIGVVFVWARLHDDIVTWERRVPVGMSCRVGRVPDEGARADVRSRGEHVHLHADGSMDIRVRIGGRGWLEAVVQGQPDTPAVLATRTPLGGWNVTQKQAGQVASGHVRLGEEHAPIDGGAWTDWTSGRQDRDTTWRWAAGAGTSTDGRRVGLNLSTGMNGVADGEDLVWWDGTPHAVTVTALAPAGDDPAGPWQVAGPGWALSFHPVGVRAADENLGLVRSRYVQPIGRFQGTLPGPDGGPIEVVLDGVTEDHLARW